MPITKFLDPKNDFCFKQIFGTEKNRDILIQFLNDMLSLKGTKEIQYVEFQKTHQDPEIAVYKQSIVDVLCKDEAGNQFIVEMQLSHHKGFEKRAQLYAAKAYSRQIIKEDDNHKKLAVYAKLKEVVFIAVADFVMFPEKKSWISHHKMLDSLTHEHDLQDFRFIFMELKKFNKGIDELKNIRERWAYFFKHAHEAKFEDIEHLIEDAPIMKRAFEAIDQASWTEIDLNTYEDREKKYLDRLAVEASKLERWEAQARAKEEAAQKRGKEEGRAEGRVEGRAEGRAEGEAKGIEKGIEKTAIYMLKENADIEFIARVTGLSESNILKLKNKL